MSQAAAGSRSGEHFLRVLGRHQLSSLLGSAVDYAVMILLVSAIGLGPVTGTVIGAACGAVTNFLLNRHFTFKATDQRARGQMLRYVLVSGASCGWNALGEHLFAVELGIQYIVARLIVGLITGLLWNYPLHRYWVFRARDPM